MSQPLSSSPADDALPVGDPLDVVGHAVDRPAGWVPVTVDGLDQMPAPAEVVGAGAGHVVGVPTPRAAGDIEAGSAAPFGPSRPAPAAVEADLSQDADLSQLVALYESHRMPLTRLALLLVDDLTSAEDVVQDAFAALQRRWGTLVDKTSAAGYLRTSATRPGPRSAGGVPRGTTRPPSSVRTTPPSSRCCWPKSTARCWRRSGSCRRGSARS